MSGKAASASFPEADAPAPEVLAPNAALEETWLLDPATYRQRRYSPLDGRSLPEAPAPARSSRLKIVWGNLGTEPGGGTLVGLAGGGGVWGRGAGISKSLARQSWLVQSSPARAKQAPAQGTTPAV